MMILSTYLIPTESLTFGTHQTNHPLFRLSVRSTLDRAGSRRRHRMGGAH